MPIQAAYHFPRGFLWGTATAAHQVEGNNTNNQWWKWEQEGHTKGTSGLACDWWGGRWKEDFDRAAEGGQNAHRLSVEWSRIQPTPDTWDEDALERYRNMLRGLRDRGITPMITLHHFSDPLWFYEMDGWERDEAVALFEKFVRKTVEALKEYCTLWCTINEPNIYALYGYILGNFPTRHRGIRIGMQVMANMLRGHATAYHAIHEIQREARVGYAHHHRPMVSKRAWSPLDAMVRKLYYDSANLTFPSGISTGTMRTPIGRFQAPEAKGTQDFLGLNYYSVDTIGFHLGKPKELFTVREYSSDADVSATKYLANIPTGLFETIQWAVRAYPNLPILITENGVDDSNDDLRRRYIAQHIHQMWRAVNFNWPVKGYFHWTLVDNFEWERGWTQRFGLWGLDVETQKRTKRPSADLYAEICKENGLSSEMIQKYCPEVFDKLFPV
jgi:beta-glucosidase